MRHRSNPRAAFTLIEVILALTIFTVAMGGIIQAIALQVRTQGITEDTTRAVMLAENLLDEIRYSEALEEDQKSGEYEEADLGFTWSYLREETGRQGLDKYTVTVSWMDGRAQRSHVLEAYIAER